MVVKKSFTLIEVLVAATLFVIIMLVFIVAIWGVTRPKAKTDTMSALQETARLAVAEITNNIFRANAKETSKGYAFFGITNLSDTAKACAAPQCSSDSTYNRLSTYERFPVEFGGGTVTRSFGLNLDGSSLNTLQMKEKSCNSAGSCATEIRNISLPEANVNVISISLFGYYWTIDSSGLSTNDRYTQEYMEVVITTQSRTQNSQGTYDTYTLKSLVTPLYGEPSIHNINYEY